MADIKILDLTEATEITETTDYIPVVDTSDTAQDVTGTTKRATVRKLLGDRVLPDTIVGTTETQTLTNKTLTSPVINTGVSGTAILDEDNMASDSATKLATQQSIKAYVDTKRASVAIPYAINTFSKGDANYTTTSTSFNYIDQTYAKSTLTLKYGKLVKVDICVTGIWNSNTGYVIDFDIGLGGTETKSTSGHIYRTAVDWTADGTQRGVFYGTFYFVDAGTGSKDFYALWASGNASVTAYISQYAVHWMSVTELFI